MDKITDEMRDALYDVLTKVTTKEDCIDLLKDLLTTNEINQLAQRLEAAKLIKMGQTYTQIIASTDISSATLARVSACVKTGKGYNKFIKIDK